MSALTNLRARITRPDGSLADRATIAAEIERAIAEESTRAQPAFDHGRRVDDGPKTPRPDIVPSPQKPSQDGYWWCPNCVREVHPARVTFEEKHDGCGAHRALAETQSVLVYVEEGLGEFRL